MKKKICIIFILLCLILTGCFKQKQINNVQDNSFDVSRYHNTYIRNTLNGRFWYIYAIMIEKEPDTLKNTDNYIVLKKSQDNSGDYIPLFRIPNTDYRYDDLILGNLDYMFLIKNNIIIRYEMLNGNRKEFNINYPNIDLLGIIDNYIYFKSTKDNNIKYYKSHFSFENIVSIKENDVPNNYTFTPILGEQENKNNNTFN